MSWEPAIYEEDYQCLDVSAIPQHIVAANMGVSNEQERLSKRLINDFERIPFLDLELTNKDEQNEKVIIDMLRIDGIQKYSDYKFDSKHSITNPKVEDKVIYNKSIVPILMSNDFFKYARSAEFEFDQQEIDKRILEEDLPLHERCPSIFPKEEDGQDVVFETFKMKAPNVASVDYDFNVHTFCFNPTSESSNNSSSSASSIASISPERGSRNKKLSKNTFMRLNVCDLFSYTPKLDVTMPSSIASISPERGSRNKKLSKNTFMRLNVCDLFSYTPKLDVTMPPGEIKCSDRQPMCRDWFY